jgi:hypothetical protein
MEVAAASLGSTFQKEFPTRESLSQKSSKTHAKLSPAHSSQTSGQQNQLANEFLHSSLSIRDFFWPKENLEPRPPMNARDYIKKRGNTGDAARKSAQKEGEMRRLQG